MPLNFSPSRRYAFTLPELLVVLALIALLVSMAIPAVGRARDSANLALCKTRLRSLGLGALMYAHNNASVLPVSKTFLPVNGRLDNPQPQLMALLAAGHYLDDPCCYYCPSEKRPELMFSSTNVTAGNIGYFYFCCDIAPPKNRVLSIFLWRDVAWPRILRDSLPPATWIASDAWFSGLPSAHHYFKKAVNYVRLDGAVSIVYEGPRESFR